MNLTRMRPKPRKNGISINKNIRKCRSHRKSVPFVRQNFRSKKKTFFLGNPLIDWRPRPPPIQPIDQSGPGLIHSMSTKATFVENNLVETANNTKRKTNDARLWIFDHAGIDGNEITDKHVELTIFDSSNVPKQMNAVRRYEK